MRLLNVFPFVTVLCLAATAYAQTADEWIERVDRNTAFASAEYTAKMTIHLPRGGERIFRFAGQVVGDELAMMEFLEPPSQKGIRYLKRDKNLWIYFPRQDRTMQIQGHMLRQGVQGSDLSYEDLTESSEMRKLYSATITGQTDTTVTILLQARDMTVSYPYRELLIDKRNSLPLRIVSSDAGNHPIKEEVMLKTRRFGERVYPVVSEIRSRLIEDKWTRFEVEDIRFGVKFPLETFTKKVLEK